MPSLNKTMKISENNLKRLHYLKPEFQEKKPDVYFSNDRVLQELISIYSSLKTSYVSREKYDSLVDEKMDLTKQNKNLKDQLKDKDVVFEKSVNDLRNTIKRQIGEIQKLESIVFSKDKTIKDLEKENSVLSGNIKEFKIELGEKADELKNLRNDYNKVCNALDNEYLPLRFLEVIYYIVLFLSSPIRRHRWYTEEQIFDNILEYCTGEEIGFCLGLWRYKVFPFTMSKDKHGNLFYRFKEWHK